MEGLFLRELVFRHSKQQKKPFSKPRVFKLKSAAFFLPIMILISSLSSLTPKCSSLLSYSLGSLVASTIVVLGLYTEFESIVDDLLFFPRSYVVSLLGIVFPPMFVLFLLTNVWFLFLFFFLFRMMSLRSLSNLAGKWNSCLIIDEVNRLYSKAVQKIIPINIIEVLKPPIYPNMSNIEYTFLS